MANPLLSAELAAVRGELTRVDAKCGTLAGLAGAATAFTTTQVGHGPLMVRVLLGAAGVLLAAATLVLLVVLRPRLGSTGFRRYAGMQVPAIGELLAAPEQTPRRPDECDRTRTRARTREEIECEDLRVLSQIANRKFLGLRASVDLIALAVVVMAAALLAGVIA